MRSDGLIERSRGLGWGYNCWIRMICLVVRQKMTLAGENPQKMTLKEEILQNVNRDFVFN
jgi:hypothetical protein